jgi:hypothetical protein
VSNDTERARSRGGNAPGKVFVRCCESRSWLRTPIQEGQTRPGMKTFFHKRKHVKSKEIFLEHSTGHFLKNLLNEGFVVVDAYLDLIILWTAQCVM